MIKKVTAFFASSLREAYDNEPGFSISVALRKARQIPVRLLEAHEHRDRYIDEAFCRQDFEGAWQHVHLGSADGRLMDSALCRAHRLEAELIYCRSDSAIVVRVRLYGRGRQKLLHEASFVVSMHDGKLYSPFEP